MTPVLRLILRSAQFIRSAGLLSLVIFFAAATEAPAIENDSASEDLLMHSALGLARGDSHAETDLKKTLEHSLEKKRYAVAVQAAQLLAISPMSEKQLQDPKTAPRKRHVFAQMALETEKFLEAPVLTSAERDQLGRIAADGFFDAQDLPRARHWYQQIESSPEFGAYARYRLAWVDWNEKKPLQAWSGLAALLSPESIQSKQSPDTGLQLLAAKDLGRLLLECPTEDPKVQAQVFVALVSSKKLREEAVRGMLQGYKRILTPPEMENAWRWLDAIAAVGRAEAQKLLADFWVKSLESGEPWQRFACSTLDRVASSARPSEGFWEDLNWSALAERCLKEDATVARGAKLLGFAIAGAKGILGNPVVSEHLVRRFLGKEATSELRVQGLKQVLQACENGCFSPETRWNGWKAWALALPLEQIAAHRMDVERVMENTSHTALTAADWGLELALSPDQGLSDRLVVRLQRGTLPVSRELRAETAQRLVRMGAEGRAPHLSAQAPLWLRCAQDAEYFAAGALEVSDASFGNCLRDSAAVESSGILRDWNWVSSWLDQTQKKIARGGSFRFTPALPKRVERELRFFSVALRQLGLHTWSDARLLTRAQERLALAVAEPWFARLSQVALPVSADPTQNLRLGDLKEKFLLRTREGLGVLFPQVQWAPPQPISAVSPKRLKS